MYEIKCNQCEWEGDAADCESYHSPEHDVICPQCGTTNVNTSKLAQQYREVGSEYCYGDDNTLIKKKEGKHGNTCSKR